MFKQLACIALLFAVCATADFNPNRKPWGPRPGPNGNDGQWVSNLCANESLAQEFLIQTQQLIDTLQSNGSFTRFLEDRAQAIAYIENSANNDLASSNCTAYFNGLKTAKDADRIVAQKNREYYGIAAKAMRKIIRNLRGESDTSSSENND